MRVPFKEMLKKLSVPGLLSAYQTNPWLLYDEGKSVTCAAEVRMGPGAQDMEAELQFVYDNSEDVKGHNPEQIFIMRIYPVADGTWSPSELEIKGTVYPQILAGWEEKGCQFFSACVQAIQIGKLPDIDRLIDKHMKDDGATKGGRGRIGRKSPKVDQKALLGMKK